MAVLLESLSATIATNYSLWRVCKNLNKPLNPKPPIRLNTEFLKAPSCAQCYTPCIRPMFLIVTS